MKFITFKMLIISSIILMGISNVHASKIDLNLYENVDSDVITISLDEENYVTTTYNLLQLSDDGDELYDYYVFETISYFSKDGDKLNITHSTNNAAIVFETAEFSVNRLMSGENKFLTFFSELNNYTKVNCKMIDDSENVWKYTRQLYAMKRYFDNTYTFENLTAFRVMADREIQIDLEVEGVFSTNENINCIKTITYNSVNEKTE